MSNQSRKKLFTKHFFNVLNIEWIFCLFLEGNCQPGCEHSTNGNSEYNQHQNHIVLSELPEPPIPLSEIGPIPPPPMFSTPSPTNLTNRSQNLQSNNMISTNLNLLHPPNMDYNEYDYDEEEEEESDLYRYSEDIDSEEEYVLQKNIASMRVEEIPVKEPVLNAVPIKSALKKKNSCDGASAQSNQDTTSRPLIVRQDNSSNMHRQVFTITTQLSIITFIGIQI